MYIILDMTSQWFHAMDAISLILRYLPNEIILKNAHNLHR